MHTVRSRRSSFKWVSVFFHSCINRDSFEFSVNNNNHPWVFCIAISEDLRFSSSCIYVILAILSPADLPAGDQNCSGRIPRNDRTRWYDSFEKWKKIRKLKEMKYNKTAIKPIGTRMVVFKCSKWKLDICFPCWCQEWANVGFLFFFSKYFNRFISHCFLPSTLCMHIV